MEMDLSFQEMITRDLADYKAHIRRDVLRQDDEFWQGEMDIETTFTIVEYSLARSALIYSWPRTLGIFHAARAMRHRSRLPEELQIPGDVKGR